MPWKSKDKACERPIEGSGLCHAVHAQRHLERHCDKVGRSSIVHRVIEKKKIKEEHQEEVSAQEKKHQEELANNDNE